MSKSNFCPQFEPRDCRFYFGSVHVSLLFWGSHGYLIWVLYVRKKSAERIFLKKVFFFHFEDWPSLASQWKIIVIFASLYLGFAWNKFKKPQEVWKAFEKRKLMVKSASFYLFYFNRCRLSKRIGLFLHWKEKWTFFLDPHPFIRSL